LEANAMQAMAEMQAVHDAAVFTIGSSAQQTPELN
jgi:hypothetical protein